jgi:hypothetical protein
MDDLREPINDVIKIGDLPAVLGANAIGRGPRRWLLTADAEKLCDELASNRTNQIAKLGAAAERLVRSDPPSARSLYL